MIPDALELRLRDGTPVVARPLNPGDRSYVADGYRMFSHKLDHCIKPVLIPPSARM